MGKGRPQRRYFFSMKIICKKKRCKLVIDGVSVMSVISTHTINLKAKPHPHYHEGEKETKKIIF